MENEGIRGEHDYGYLGFWDGLLTWIFGFVFANISSLILRRLEVYRSLYYDISLIVALLLANVVVYFLLRPLRRDWNELENKLYFSVSRLTILAVGMFLVSLIFLFELTIRG